MLVLAFYYAAYWMANIMGNVFFGGFGEPKPWGGTWLLASLAAVLINGLLMKTYFECSGSWRQFWCPAI